MTLVVFDIDGTLIDTDGINDHCFVTAVKEIWGGHVRVDSEGAAYALFTDPGVANEIHKALRNSDAKEEDLVKLEEIFYDKVAACYRSEPHRRIEIEGARAFIDRLRAENIPVAFATGGWKKMAALKLKEMLGLDLEDFPHATASDHITRHEIMRTAIKRTENVSDETRIVYFGDGIWDYKTCLDLEVDFIGIDRRGRGYLEKAGAQHIFRNYLDQEKMLKLVTGVGNQ